MTLARVQQAPTRREKAKRELSEANVRAATAIEWHDPTVISHGHNDCIRPSARSKHGQVPVSQHASVGYEQKLRAHLCQDTRGFWISVEKSECFVEL